MISWSVILFYATATANCIEIVDQIKVDPKYKFWDQLNFDPVLCSGKWIKSRISSTLIWSMAWSCSMQLGPATWCWAGFYLSDICRPTCVAGDASRVSRGFSHRTYIKVYFLWFDMSYSSWFFYWLNWKVGEIWRKYLASYSMSIMEEPIVKKSKNESNG